MNNISCLQFWRPSEIILTTFNINSKSCISWLQFRAANQRWDLEDLDRGCLGGIWQGWEGIDLMMLNLKTGHRAKRCEMVLSNCINEKKGEHWFHCLLLSKDCLRAVLKCRLISFECRSYLWPESIEVSWESGVVPMFPSTTVTGSRSHCVPECQATV